MRGIVRTLSRSSASVVLTAGICGLALTITQASGADSGHSGLEQTALAVPRPPAPGRGAEIGLPQPLSPSDAAVIRRIFDDQAHGRMARAKRATAGLQNHVLLGSILADRYAGRFYKASIAELQAWMLAYADQPGAPTIHRLLAHRLPQKAKLPPFEAAKSLAPEALTDAAPEDADPSDQKIDRDPSLESAVAQRVRAADYAAALRLIADPPRLNAAAAAMLRAGVARGLFADGRDQEALQVAADAIRRAPSEQLAGAAALVAGLAAWRLQCIGLARSYFAQAADAPLAPAAVRAAGSFWAARAALRQDDTASHRAWLRRAASGRRTFYGLIARRILGWRTGLTMAHEALSKAELDAIAATPAGSRGFALLQVGQDARAEAEFRSLWPVLKNSPAARRALLLVAGTAHLTDLAAQLANLVQEADGTPHDDLRFPVPRLRPADGFRVDPALVYGIARTESNFDVAAVSACGARGLMQIMPSTARALTGRARLTEAMLRDPGYNLSLGQRLLDATARQPAVGHDLIRLLAAYNAGVGSVASWAPKVADNGDALMFLEAIPIPQTRRYAQRVLSYTWIYAARLGLPAPSLDEIAAGRFPRFTPLSPKRTVVAWMR